MVKISTKTIRYSRFVGFVFFGVCILQLQLAYSEAPLELFPSPIRTTNADVLTQSQRDTISHYSVGEYYSVHLKIVEISNPKKISYTNFVNRLHLLDSLFLKNKNGDSSVVATDFDLITFDFFPKDPPLTLVYKGYTQIESMKIGIRITDVNGLDTIRDSITQPYKLYDVQDKVKGGMASLSFVLTKNRIGNHPIFMRFRDRPYCYSLEFLGDDTYFMIKTIYEN